MMITALLKGKKCLFRYDGEQQSLSHLFVFEYFLYIFNLIVNVSPSLKRDRIPTEPAAKKYKRMKKKHLCRVLRVLLLDVLVSISSRKAECSTPPQFDIRKLVHTKEQLADVWMYVLASHDTQMYCWCRTASLRMCLLCMANKILQVSRNTGWVQRKTFSTNRNQHLVTGTEDDIIEYLQISYLLVPVEKFNAIKITGIRGISSEFFKTFNKKS